MSGRWPVALSIAGLLHLAACLPGEAGDAAVGQEAGSGGPARTAFVGAHVIPMTHDTVLTDQTVLIEGGRVTAIGRTGDVAVPEGATVIISARGRYLLPGLIDAHVHLAGSGAREDLRLYPVHGVTSVINMRGEPAHVRWREEIRRGAAFGPDLYTSGPFVEASESASDADDLVRHHEASEYDLIKVRGEIPAAELGALVRAARERGIPVAGHVSEPAGVAGAVQAGQDVIEHAEGLLQTFFEGRIEPERLGGLADVFREAAPCVTPTLVAYQYVVRQTEEYPELARLLARPELSYLDPELVRGWRPDRNGYVTRWRGQAEEVPAALDRFRREFDFLKRITRALYEAGVPLLAGTDASIAFVVPGISLHEELRLLQEAGLPPFAVLETATVNPSRCYAWLGESGTIEAGKRADLVLVDANPLEDLSVLMEPSGVMLRGSWIQGADLRGRLPREREDAETSS